MREAGVTCSTCSGAQSFYGPQFYHGTISLIVSASHAGSFTREVRALAVTVYFSSASALWLYDSIHLAIIMLQAGHSHRTRLPTRGALQVAAAA